ncbi:MAG: LysM peptidoglycan-binding domain-containing protein [Anaerolineae bacterium]
MKTVRPASLGILSLSVLLILAAGCYKPAAPDVTPTSAAGAGVATPEGQPDLEATAIANATLAAQTEAEAEQPTEEPSEPPATATSEPVTSPLPTPVPTSAPVATAAPSETTTHVVQPGENLFGVAVRYGTTVQAIIEANGIANPQVIYVGQELVIPSGGAQPSQPQPSTGGTTYVVQPGDNLFRIALRYDMSYLRLAEYNGIANPSNVYVGQVLEIPPQ